ncbi:hypothetical protein [Inhella sp.]|uniref:hypothetical protein n=1 Tax=Inhella sp. TaxID=1921806 RepID=UPI0035B09DC0
MRRHALSLVLPALLTACGGGEEPPSLTQARTDTGPQRRALATLPSVGAKEVMDWAQYKFPTLFPGNPASQPFNYLGVDYTIRAYSTGNYLGVTPSGEIYGLGEFTGGQLQSFGKISDWSSQIQADACGVYPSLCSPGGGGTGTLNACAQPASQALAIGNRYTLNYALTMSGAVNGSGEFQTDALVEAATSFEGQSAVRLALTQTNSLNIPGTQSSTIKLKQYAQAADNGLIRHLGNESETSVVVPVVGNSVTNVKTVNTPPFLNSEFTLQAGQSLTRTNGYTTTTTTTVAGVTTPPMVSNSSLTETVSFEARETIQVQGRSWDTCRYRQVDAATPNVSTTTWYIVGRGLPARIVGSGSGTTQTTELKSGTVNGAPI